jgi:hypothetical protein
VPGIRKKRGGPRAALPGPMTSLLPLSLLALGGLIGCTRHTQPNSNCERIPLFTEKEVTDAMTRISELSYEEVISDFRAATGFVRNCRAGKIVEFELEKVKTLFDEKEGSVVLQLERLERLGFLSRIIVKEGDALLPRFRIPRLFTRCWETST